MTRRHISARERVEIFQRHSGVCHICKGKIDAGREAWDVEHETALADCYDLHGTLIVDFDPEGPENLKPAHNRCHKPKSAQEATVRGKVKRNQQRTMGIPKQTRNPLPGGKNDKWKRTINRGTVPRD